VVVPVSEEFQGLEFIRTSADQELCLQITRIPMRKSVALCLQETTFGVGATWDVLGYFRDEEHAMKAIEVLRKFIPNTAWIPNEEKR
jgi:hypothetical protein